MSRESLLKGINDPEDLKGLTIDQLKNLSEEVRLTIIKNVNRNGGHMASNLGAVDFTIALHYVFNSPEDRIIWDVGHQCYTHKILTGRKAKFSTIRKKDGLSGFPKPSESPHDVAETGHASTSISTGLGITVGNGIQSNNSQVISVIGDGALNGGLALEALNWSSHVKRPLIIILNDNRMSINKNVGGLSVYLSRMSVSHNYTGMRNSIDKIIRHIPLIGKGMLGGITRLKRGVKGMFYKENLFTDLGIKYVGPVNGHDMEQLIKTFKAVQQSSEPVVVHLITQKGKGHPEAEGDPSSYHGVSPIPEKTEKTPERTETRMTQAFSNALMELAEENPEIAAITAGMTEGTGLTPFQKRFPERFFDVGITEGHAITFAAGLSLTGLRPVVSIYSTFMQRSVDQLIHDVALPKLPVIITMDRAGLVPDDGETHQGTFDISLFRNIPGITLMAPVNEDEMKSALQYSLDAGGPCLIRYAKDKSYSSHKNLKKPFKKGRGTFLFKSREETTAPSIIVNFGGLLSEVEKCRKALLKESIYADVYNLRFAAPLDTDYLLDIFKEYRYVFIVEEGTIKGGVGEKIGMELFMKRIPVHYRNFGTPDTFLPHATRKELIKECGLDSQSLKNAIIDEIQSTRFKQVVEQVKNDKWGSAL